MKNTLFWFKGKRSHLRVHPTTLLMLLALVAGAGPLCGADNSEADKLLAAAKAKELHAQELRTAAAAALQKAADDEMDAGAEERQARILSAQALQLLKADANKQRAFQLRHEARQLWAEGNVKAIEARNDEARIAQQNHNAEELKKAAAQLHDQPTIAATLENDAKAQEAQVQRETQLASTASNEVSQLYHRAAEAWREAEKLDPETHQKVAPQQSKVVVVPKREVR
jgi:hypothetical protein